MLANSLLGESSDMIDKEKTTLTNLTLPGTGTRNAVSETIQESLYRRHNSDTDAGSSLSGSQAETPEEFSHNIDSTRFS